MNKLYEPKSKNHRGALRWLIALFTLVIMSPLLSAQGTIQIGGGTATSTVLPINSCWGYNYSQQIYTSTEYIIGGGAAGDITGIRFYYTSGGTNLANWANGWTVYLGHTTKTSFTNDIDWVDSSELTAVYTGNLIITGNSWIEITFDTPFTYDGVSNIVVAIDENTPGFSCTATWWSYTASSNRGLMFRDDTINPNPASPPTSTIAPTSALAQIQFIGQLATCPPPANISYSAVSPTSITVNWAISDAIGYDYELRTSGAAQSGEEGLVEEGSTQTNSVTFNNLTAGVSYQFYLRSDCDMELSLWAGPIAMMIIPGNNCDLAIDLGSLTSPLSSTTLGASDNFFTPCSGGNTSPDLFYFIEVPPNATLVIGQTVNDYDSENYVGYGACPGTGVNTQIACYDDPDIQNSTWVNTTGQTQTVYWVQDGYFNMANAGGFTLAWNIIPAPACIPVNGLVAQTTSTTTATISWNIPNPAPSDGYEYVVSTINSIPVEAGIPSLTNSVTLENLIPGTTYFVFVRSICDTPDVSEWVGPASFSTIEGNTCDLAINLATLTSPFSGTTVGATNDNTVTCAGGNTSPDLFYFIEVPVNFTLVIGQTVNAYDSENYVGYGGCPGTTQIACWDDPDIQNITWTNNTGSTQTVYWVQDGYFNNANAGTFTLAWTLTAPPTCFPPTGLAATPQIPSSANVSWLAPIQAPAEGYEYVVSTSNTTPVGSGTYTTATSAALEGLTANTPYFLFVRSVCGENDFSTWAGPISFNIVLGNTCAEALDLSTLPNPYSGTTVGATNNSTVTCAGGNAAPDLFFFIEVPNGATLQIGQTENGYDSENYVGYGGCPGTNQIACFDDPDLLNIIWTNTTGETQTVYWVQDGWNTSITTAGTFTLAWTVTLPEPTCDAPAGLNAEIMSVLDQEVMISWDAPANAPTDGYEYVVSTSSDTPSSNGIAHTQTSALINGMEYDTNYHLFVRSICDAETELHSSWVGPFTFSIPAPVGCTDALACNYDPIALVDDESCTYETTWYQDADGDGFGNFEVSMMACEMPENYVSNGTDCDDSNDSVWVSAELFIDTDGDGYAIGSEVICYGAEIPAGYATESMGVDCNDNNSEVYQSGDFYKDLDGDGYHSSFVAGLCYGEFPPFGHYFETLGEDCDDEDASAWQSAELFIDMDGDGYDAGMIDLCYGEEIPEGYKTETLGDDCNDDDVTAWEPTQLNVTVSFEIFAPLCWNFSETIELSGGSPEGGVWSGQGVTGNTFNSGVFSQDGNIEVTYTVAGDNACIIGGSASTFIPVVFCSSVGENGVSFELYPSVTTGAVTINSSELIRTVTFMNVNGQLIETRSVNNSTGILNIENFANGIYLLRVDGLSQSQTFRIAKVN